MLSKLFVVVLALTVLAVPSTGCDELLDDDGAEYDAQINTICEAHCAREVECFDMDEANVDLCVEECFDRTHQIREQTDRDCFEAELQLTQCEVELTCEQIEDANEHCSTEIDDHQTTCS